MPAAQQAQAQATAAVNQSQSIALMRNLMRLNFSQLTFSRGIFPAESFERKDGAPKARARAAPARFSRDAARASHRSQRAPSHGPRLERPRGSRLTRGGEVHRLDGAGRVPGADDGLPGARRPRGEQRRGCHQRNRGVGHLRRVAHQRRWQSLPCAANRPRRRGRHHGQGAGRQADAGQGPPDLAEDDAVAHRHGAVPASAAAGALRLDAAPLPRGAQA